jgi:hypothetical protein
MRLNWQSINTNGGIDTGLRPFRNWQRLQQSCPQMTDLILQSAAFLQKRFLGIWLAKASRNELLLLLGDLHS